MKLFYPFGFRIRIHLFLINESNPYPSPSPSPTPTPKKKKKKKKRKEIVRCFDASHFMFGCGFSRDSYGGNIFGASLIFFFELFGGTPL